MDVVRWLCGLALDYQLRMLMAWVTEYSSMPGIFFLACKSRTIDDAIVNESMNLKPVAVAGGFNAWGNERGSTYTNARGDC